MQQQYKNLSECDFQTPASGNSTPLAALLFASNDWVFSIDSSGQFLKQWYKSEQFERQTACLDAGDSLFKMLTKESYPKLESLLSNTSGYPGSTQLNLTIPSEDDLPVTLFVYSHIDNEFLCAAQSMTDLARSQQSLIETQVARENDFAKLSDNLTTLEVVFESTTDAFLKISADKPRVFAQNRAAERLFQSADVNLIDTEFPAGFSELNHPALNSMLEAARRNGASGNVGVSLQDNTTELLVSANYVRGQTNDFFLVRCVEMDQNERINYLTLEAQDLIRLMNDCPDGIVVCQADGTIVSANAAFATMAQVETESVFKGHSLESWLGRNALDQRLICKTLRSNGKIAKFMTVVVGKLGVVTEVELSAGLLSSEENSLMVLIVRNVASRVVSRNNQHAEAGLDPKRVASVKDMVGRVSLKEVVRESTDIVEKMCIEAALELTNGNRASAAEVLGVSRQSLYVKLRRLGLASSTESEDYIQSESKSSEAL